MLPTDSVYKKTVSIPDNRTIEFKFWKSLRGTDFEVIDNNPIHNRVATLTLNDTTLVVVYFDNDSTYPITSIAMMASWNMVSVPRIVNNPLKTALFPTATSAGFGYHNGYQPQDSMKNGEGYWLKVNSPETVSVVGNALTLDSTTVNAGWNMIGSLTNPIPTSSITTNPSGIVVSNYFGFNGSYTVAATITPGQAYWVKASQTGKLVLNFSAFAKVAINDDLNDAVVHLSVVDAAGRSQTLSLIQKSSKTSVARLELAPIPPADAFDVRFASNRMAEVMDLSQSGLFPIGLASPKYPVTIQWDARATEQNVTMNVGKRRVSLNSSGSVVVANAQE